MGIEGWFKIVVISALNDIIKSINNKGAYFISIIYIF